MARCSSRRGVDGREGGEEDARRTGGGPVVRRGGRGRSEETRGRRGAADLVGGGPAGRAGCGKVGLDSGCCETEKRNSFFFFSRRGEKE